ncbi:uncharacterized protein Dana_GF17002 [Drosophila ananassae]|uniref:SAM domain-containing protein n=1 Tax=Drosophila ananassae TaxID=7217 RepID=B3LUZ5_DROAN|nr:uncharacterized protein LOC6499791 [Drosophila ananassae]EDV42467.1 uncharacterized protein Dana_GF17002 [Drosophila ananassae]
MCRRAVREWLVLLTMEKYIGKFLERGYDSIASCKQILLSDLVVLGVEDASHRKLLLAGVQFLINSPERFICLEPCELHNLTDAKIEAVSAPIPELESVSKSPDFDFFDTNTGERERDVLLPLPKPASTFKKSGIPVFSKSTFYSKDEEPLMPTLDAKITAAVKEKMINLTCPQLLYRHMPDVDPITYTNDDITYQNEVADADCTITEDDPDLIILD